MKAVPLGVLLGVVVAGSTASVVQAQTSDEEAVRQVVEAIAAYEQAGDLAAVDTLFAPGRGVHIIEGRAWLHPLLSNPRSTVDAQHGSPLVR